MTLEHHGWVLFRTPLLPFDYWQRWTTMADAGSKHNDRARAPEPDVTLRAGLKTLLSPVFWEALFFASPALFESIFEWHKDPHSRRGRAAENALVAYFSRMTTRPTPFGVCAGVTVAPISEKTTLELAPSSQYIRDVTIDLRVLKSIVRILEADPFFRAALRYRPNSTLNLVGGRFKYLDIHTGRIHKDVRVYQSVAYQATEALQRAIDLAVPGASIQELCDGLSDLDRPAAGFAFEATSFVEELIRNRILVSDLNVSISGPKPVVDLISQISALDATNVDVRTLQKTFSQLAELNRRPIGEALKGYQEISIDLGRICKHSVEPSKRLHADLHKPPICVQIGSNVIQEIISAVHILHSISRPIDTPWRKFKQDFLERFGEAEVPLSLALDEELGVPFERSVRRGSSDLLDGVLLETRANSAIEWTARDALLLRLVCRALAARETEISLREADLTQLENRDKGQLTDSFSVLATILAPSPEAIDRGDYQILFNDGYLSSSAAYGRFCFVDPGLKAKVRDLLDREERHNESAIFAEVVHYPGGEELGNIVSRPIFSQFEIPYDCSSSLPADYQIPVSDISVSVRRDRVILMSKRLNKEIIPRLSVAHAFTKPMNAVVYKFLCALPFQVLRSIPVWSWGTVFQSMPFLPRLRFGKIIISPATWNLNKQEIHDLVSTSRNDACDGIRGLREKRGIPRMVLLREDNHYLPIDFENALSARMLLHQIRKRDQAKITELLPTPEQVAMRGPEGRYCHEVAVPLHLTPTSNRQPSLGVSLRSEYPQENRLFPPGSDWLYAKIYSSPAILERALVEQLWPLILNLKSQSAIAEWFFIRYRDPDYHIRIRFRLNTVLAWGDLLLQLRETLRPLFSVGALKSLEIDTYSRELERYGGLRGIQLAEKAFCLDSELCLERLSTVYESSRVSDRLEWIVSDLDLLLSAFQCHTNDCLTLFKTMRDRYRTEFRIQPKQKQAIAQKFRLFRQVLLRTVNQRRNIEDENYSTKWHSVAYQFRKLAEDGMLYCSIGDIITEFIHLCINRRIRSDPRQHEMVIYDLLYRTYDASCNDRRSTVSKLEHGRAI